MMVAYAAKICQCIIYDQTYKCITLIRICWFITYYNKEFITFYLMYWL